MYFYVCRLLLQDGVEPKSPTFNAREPLLPLPPLLALQRPLVVVPAARCSMRSSSRGA